MSRPVCSVFIATSLDGYIARPDGAVDWLTKREAPAGEDYGYQAFFDSVDVLIMGRRTYDTVRAFETWPYGAKRCVVLTHHPSPPAHGEALLSSTPEALVERLGREGARRIYVDGGEVIRQFLQARLVDDLTLTVIPVILGDGVRLFERGLPERWLELESSRSWGTGLTQLKYRLG